MRALILDLIAEVAETVDVSITPDLSDATVLLESGLDSLGFAILVSRLEEDLGFDPFSEMEDVVYPNTLGAFIAVYEQHAP